MAKSNVLSIHRTEESLILLYKAGIEINIEMSSMIKQVRWFDFA